MTSSSSSSVQEQKIIFFPRNALTSNLTKKTIESNIRLTLPILDENQPNPQLNTYYLLLPKTAFIPGAKTFDQFARRDGQTDPALFQLFLAQYIRKGGKVYRGSRRGALLSLLDLQNKAWLLTLREIVPDTNDEKDEQAAENEGGGPRPGERKVEDEAQQIRRWSTVTFNNWICNRLTQKVRYPEILTYAKDAKIGMLDWPDLKYLSDSGNYAIAIANYLGQPANEFLQALSEWKALTKDNVSHPLYTSNIFTLENARIRFRGLTGITLTDTQLLDYGPSPRGNPHAYILPHPLAYPVMLRTIFMPSYEPIKDYDAIGFQNFALQYAHSGKTEEEIRALWDANRGFSYAQTGSLNIDEFTKLHKARLQKTEPQTELHTRYKAEVFHEFPSVFNELVDSGEPFFRTIEFGNALRACNHGHYSLDPGIHPLAVSMDPFVAISQNFIGICEDTGSIAYAHAIIYLLVAAIHSNAQDDDKGLNASLVIAGMAGISKSFALKFSARFGIPNLVRFIAWRSALSRTMDADNRGYVEFYDELTRQMMGMPMQMDERSLFSYVVHRGSASSNNTDAVSKNTMTNRVVATDYMSIEKGTGRIQKKSASVQYGATAGAMNDSSSECSKAMAQRVIFVEVKECKRATGDMITSMRQDELIAHVEKLYQQKKALILCKWFHRSQVLSTMYYIIKNTGAIPDVNLSGFNLRMDLLMNALTKYVGIEPRLSRSLLNLQRFAKVFTLWRAIYLVFDLGIGGLDRGRPFEIADLDLLSPFLVCTDVITFFTAELVPLFQPLVMMDILKALRELLGVRYQSVDDPKNPAYKLITGFFGSKLASQFASSKCGYLASKLHQYLSGQHELRSIFCVLAELSTNVVYDSQSQSRVPCLVFGEGDTFCADLRIHRNVLDLSVDENSVFNAWREILHPDAPPMAILRGKIQTDDRRSDAWKGFQIVDKVVSPLQALYTRRQAASDRLQQGEPGVFEEYNRANQAYLQASQSKAYISQGCSSRTSSMETDDAESYFCGNFDRPDAAQVAQPPQVYPPHATEAQKREHIATSNGRQQSCPFLDEEVIERHLQALGICDPLHVAFPHNLKKVLQAIYDVRLLLQNGADISVLQLRMMAKRMWDTYRYHKALPEGQMLSELHIKEFLMGLGLKSPLVETIDWTDFTDHINYGPSELLMDGELPPLEDQEIEEAMDVPEADAEEEDVDEEVEVQEQEQGEEEDEYEEQEEEVQAMDE